MSEINIMDASAIIALLQGEPGEQAVKAALLARPSRIASVNYCEVISKFRERGAPLNIAVQSLDNLELHCVDFDRTLAIAAAELRPITKPIGASLADRACLACAAAALESGDLPTVYTTDRQWTTLPWPFKIIVIR